MEEAKNIAKEIQAITDIFVKNKEERERQIKEIDDCISSLRATINELETLKTLIL